MELVTRLRLILSEPQLPLPLKAEGERHLAAIELDRAAIERSAHKLVFIGAVGAGKSSVQAVLGDLIVPGKVERKAPRDLQKRTMVAVSAGRTTISEVRTWGTSGEGLRVRVEPDTETAVGKELRFFLGLVLDRVTNAGALEAEDETQAGVQTAQKVTQGAGARTEVARWLANAAGYKDHYEVLPGETCAIEALLRAELERLSASMALPPTERIVREAVLDAAVDHFLARIDLPSRARTEWSWPDDSVASRKQFREVFAGINNGTLRDAPFPRNVELQVAPLLPELAARLGRAHTVSMVDTRGLDDDIDGRPDIKGHVAAADAIPVLMSRFTDTPGDVLPVLRGLRARQDTGTAARERLLIVVADKGDSGEVLGADGDVVTGRAIRANQACASLDAANFKELAGDAASARILFFSPAATLRLATDPDCSELNGEPDDRIAFVEAIARVIAQQRAKAIVEIDRHLAAAEAYLETVRDPVLLVWKERVQRDLEAAFDNTLTIEAKRENLTALAEPFLRAVDNCPYWKRIQACVFNDGDWSALHAANLISDGAYKLADRLTRTALDEVRRTAATELGRQDADLLPPRQAFLDSWLEAMDQRAAALNREMEAALRDEAVFLLEGEDYWDEARAVYGKGYCQRVRAILRHGMRRITFETLNDHIQHLIEHDLLDG